MGHDQSIREFERWVPVWAQAGRSTNFRDSRSRTRRRRSSSGFRAERLEDRQLLSADPIAIPATSASPMASSLVPKGLTPAQVRQAYGVNNITFANGSIVGDGSGQTIAIVVAYDNPYITSDLHVFNQQYGLPDASIQIIKQTASMRTNGGWALETALDVQWAHAIAPGANILLAEAKSDSLTDLMTMVNVARQQPGVVSVSMSWGTNEFAAERNYNSTFTTPLGHQGVTFVAASGDDGSWLGASFPAISPNVLGVGGTQLWVSPDGTYLGETAWSGSGGGFSKFQAEPAYQRSAQSTGLRTSPDVSWNAAVSSGVSVYSTLSDSGPGGWFAVGGTSAGTPAWAAVIAIANQGRAAYGLGSLAGAQSVLYALPGSAFRDITVGRNGYSAGAGYDLVTGLGSPYVDRVVAGLATAWNMGNGSYAVSSPARRVRRLHRFYASRHNVVATDLGPQAGASRFDPVTPANSATSIQFTTINANQALVVQVVSSNGRLIEEVVVPIPTLDVAAMTTSHPIAPITASLLIGVNPQSNAEVIGQSNDPQNPAASASTLSAETSLPSVTDLIGGRVPTVDPQHGIPAELAPQSPPAQPLRIRELLPPTEIDRTLEILTRWDRDDGLDWSAEQILIDHFSSLGCLDLQNGSDESRKETEDPADGSELAAAFAAALGGTCLIRVRRRRSRPGPQTTRPSTRRHRSTLALRPGAGPFRYLLERPWN